MAMRGPAMNGRPTSGQRPRARDTRTRAAEPASQPSAGRATPSAGVPPQGGMPLWCLPLLAAAAAAPIYGYRRCQREIAEATARYNKDPKAFKAEGSKATNA